MKKVVKSIFMLLAAALALQLTGCASLTAVDNAEWKGKVWRATISRTVYDARKQELKGEAAVKGQYDHERDRHRRATFAHFSSGWDSVMVAVVVPDQIEYSEIEKGSIVDVMIEQGDNFNYGNRFSRVLRVVCHKSDKECIDREHKAKRIRAVLDPNPPANVGHEYGHTFNRRLTQEERDKY